MTEAFDRVLHFALFVAGGIAFAVAALGVLERVAGTDGAPTIRLRHIAIPIAVFVVIGLAERMYHVVH